MSTINIDLTDLSDDQLAAFSLIDSVAAKEERQRRGAYQTLEQSLTELAKVGINLEAFLEDKRGTQAVLHLKKIDALGVITRTLAFARVNEIQYTQPSLEDIVRDGSQEE